MIKLWRNLKNLSQKQLAFVKENCSTGLRWTSVGEAWVADPLARRGQLLVARLGSHKMSQTSMSFHEAPELNSWPINRVA